VNKRDTDIMREIKTPSFPCVGTGGGVDEERGPCACPGRGGGENHRSFSSNLAILTTPPGQAQGPRSSSPHPPVPTNVPEKRTSRWSLPLIPDPADVPDCSVFLCSREPDSGQSLTATIKSTSGLLACDFERILEVVDGGREEEKCCYNEPTHMLFCALESGV
jgi:hypothetical protein